MAVFLYNVFLFLFRVATYVAAPFNGKARKWVSGRKKIFDKLRESIPRGEGIIWVHCASLGEFEQGRPLIEELKAMGTGHRILLTFFSPSGYEAQKDYPHADWVFYLPADGARNARQFLEIVKPVLVIFVKYEFWYYYLKKIKYRNIPLLLVSALFREDMSFFKWWGGLQRKMLSRFDHLFVQNEKSRLLVNGIGLGHICTVSGDTRFDRVISIAEKAERLILVETFLDNEPALVAGSTWPEDEVALERAFASNPGWPLKLIIAPHEIDEKHLQSLRVLFPSAIFFSELAAGVSAKDANYLVIDNIGMLSRLYRYAYIAYVGGGLRTGGVHNVLEAAVYAKPVLFGPAYHKYSEAVGLVETGGGIPVDPIKQPGNPLIDTISKLLADAEEYSMRSRAAGDFVRSNRGATEKILRFIQEKRLLTS